MNGEHNGKSLRTILVVCLVGLYFLLAMGVTLLGSNIYRAVASSADETSVHRTALSYVVNQVRRATADVRLGTFGGIPALRLDEPLPDGSLYATYIYCYENQLMELYTDPTAGLTVADGTVLMDLAALEFSHADGLLTVTARNSDGRAWSVQLHVEEVAPL